MKRVGIRVCAVVGVALAVCAGSAAASPTAPAPPNTGVHNTAKYGWIPDSNAKYGWIPSASGGPAQSAARSGVSATSADAAFQSGTDITLANNLGLGPADFAGTAKAGWVSDAALAADPTLEDRVAAATSLGQVTPDTSGLHCDSQVCMKVYGTNRTVTQIYTSGQYKGGVPNCFDAYAIMYLDYYGYIAYKRTSEAKPCGLGNGKFYYNFGPKDDHLPLTLIRDGYAVTFWDFIAGEPNIRVYKKK